MILSVSSRPGEGPLIITLAAMLLINMTVFCVVVGFDDLNRDKPTPTTGPSVAATSATPSPVVPQAGPPITAADRAAPIAPVPAVVPPAPRPVVNPAAPGDVSPPPVPAHHPEAAAQAEADDEADDDPPLTFFGVPVH